MVDITILTPNPTSEHLQCFVCKNYLSYFPISLCSNNKSVCGRCTIPEDLVSYKNESFEEICQHFKFPCRFQSEGCSEEFSPKDIPEHEDKCPFRVVKCIINNPGKCQWQGSLPDLLRHCENQHYDLVLKNHEFEMNPTDAEEYDNLVKYEDELLVFRRKYDPKGKKLTFSLCFSKFETSLKISSCQLSVKNGKTSVLFDFESTEAELQIGEVCLKSLYDHDEPGTFLGKLKLPENKNVTTAEHNLLNRELLEFLKCQRCSLITEPPVYHCTVDMSPVCSSCRSSHISYCRYCQNKSGGVVVPNSKFKNILCFHIQYPCKYHSNGCMFSSNYMNLIVHQTSCEYENVDCPLSDSSEECTWKGHRKDLESHIRDDHVDCIHTSQNTYKLRSDKRYIFFMKFFRHLFRLSYDFQDGGERYRWSLQKIGDFDTKYRFEVEIFCDTPGLRLLVGTRCSALSDEHLVFENVNNFCYILKDQMRCLKTDEDGNVKFKVRIFEI